MHIKHVGTAGMLLNPTKLEGIAPKIQKLAVREHRISAHHEESLGKGGRPSVPPPGPGPMQPGALPNGTRSGTSSEEPSPAKRVDSMLPEILEAPLVEIVPGIKVLFRETPFCLLHATPFGCHQSGKPLHRTFAPESALTLTARRLRNGALC